MNVHELLMELSQRGVKLWADSDQLHLRAPKGVLTLELRDVLTQHKTEILALLRRRSLAESTISIPLTPLPRHDKLPLSFAQQRLWFLAQMHPDSAVYNLPNAFRLTGPLNRTILKQSIEKIAQRHEILRTTFQNVDGQPVQVISPDIVLALPVVELQEFSAAEREAETTRLASEETQQIFDLAHGPLLRVKLLQLAEEEHLFLLTLHHIVSDGWSSMVLLRELKALYEALSVGRTPQLPDLPLQYADFASWERQWLQGEVLETQLSYWRQKLGGRIPVLELPADYPRQPVQTYCGECQSFVLSKPLVEALKVLSQREGVTLFMTLLAALKTLLYRYTEQADIIVGSPVARRNWAEIEGLIGCFINTLVLRTDLSGDPSFRELLGRVRETCTEAYAHQDLPFEKLVEELQPERHLSHSPIFQVMLILHVQDTRKIAELADLTLTPMEIHSKTAKFDLTLELQETSEGLSGWFEYSTDLFDAATTTRMQGHFQTLLAGIIADPTQRLSALPILTDAECQQLLVEWNATRAEYSHEMCLHQLIEAQAERTPDAIAVVFEDTHLTYQELNQRANQFAHYLQTLGVGPEVLIGICVEPSLEMVVGLLGILKAGGAYVPLDPAYPSERLAFMLEDAQIPVLVTQQQWVAGLPAHHAQVVCLDTDWEHIAQESAENPPSKVTANNLAYVIYTSGSTGKPKGVQVVHQGVVNFLATMRQQPGLTAQDTLLAVTTLSFDIAAMELYLPLTVGARLVLMSREVAMDGKQLARQLATSGTTVMQATPATWRLLLEAGWTGSPALKILCGGEALPRDLAEQLRQRGASLWNLYGPTETTIWSTRYAVTRQDCTVPIGRPIANTQVYVLDRHQQPVPIGVPGELYIGGHGVARGYLHRPELTAEKFVPHPFSPEPGDRLYRTGDLVRYRPDAALEFLGRLDHQVKIRGFRIELGEIEACLLQHPAVREGVVVVREDTPGDQRLVAYLVAKQQPAPTLRELRSFLQEKLPDYMLPSALILLDTLPLTPNGKVDRRVLPAPDSARPEPESALVAASDTLEIQLMEIWEEVLGIRHVGVQDDFFELGGHSLLAVRLFGQIEKVFGKELPLTLLFQAPTVAQLARLLREEGWVVPWSALVAIQPEGSNPPFFCVATPASSVRSYRDLARHLGADQPFYVLQAQGLEQTSRCHTQVKDIAAHYLNDIRRLQPEGPYFLGGDDLGGQVAFEMAQQLQAQGQTVASLALFDAYASGGPKTTLHTASVRDKPFRVGRRISQYLETLLLRVPKANRSTMPETARTARRRRKGKAEQANGLFIHDYMPHVYPGRVTLFRARQQPAGYDGDPYLGWESLAARGVEVHEVPGSYGSILCEPCARVLAELLQACLSKAQALTTARWP